MLCLAVRLACEQAHLFGYREPAKRGKVWVKRAPFFSPALGCGSPFKQVSLLAGYCQIGKQLQSRQELYRQLLPTQLYASRKTMTHTGGDEKCRLCRRAQESVAHVVSGCSVLVQTLYLTRHNAALKGLSAGGRHSTLIFTSPAQTCVSRRQCGGVLGWITESRSPSRVMGS